MTLAAKYFKLKILGLKLWKGVMAGLVPAIPISMERRCSGNGDARDKRGHD
jgi:hypothetical protein